MPLWSTLAILIGISFWDIYAVFHKRGPIKELIEMASNSTDQDPELKSKIETGEYEYDTSKLEIGIGDLAFYSMLTSSALVQSNNLLVMIFTALAIIIGTGITISGLKRNKLPKSFSLSQNFPNPFNPSTSISFNVPEGIKPHNITMKIYDLRGRLIRTLIDRNFAPGSYTVNWEGKDDRGQKVSSGVYFYRLTSTDFSQTRKMVLMK